MPNNPAKQVDPPKITHKPMKILNEAQVNIFLEATDRDPIWRDFFYTELTTGLRLGEICGLMWSDFDGRKGTLSISRTLRKEKGGRLVARGHQDLRPGPGPSSCLPARRNGCGCEKRLPTPLGSSMTHFARKPC